MVFGFFKKQPQAPPESVPLPPSPSPARAELQAESVPKLLGTPTLTQTQLRTPSPSIDSASVARGNAPQSPSPATRMAQLSVAERARQVSPTRASTSAAAPILSPTPYSPPEPTPDSLRKHLSLIPPKTLHEYILAALPQAEPPVLTSLASFFSELAPPQRLHCVRCHKDYVEVENDDRSCLVPHDDESAEVERVGRGAKAGRPAGDPGTTYETLWGCCGKITEGNGDQGPPDGWCYEGRHTTDIKRARFRADSTPHDDKLTSCIRLNCHGIRDTLPRVSLRKRPRSINLKEPDTDEDTSEGEADSGIDEIIGKAKPKARGKGKEKEKEQAPQAEEDSMDVDNEGSVVNRAGSVAPARGRPRAKSTSAAGPGVPKRRGRPPKTKPDTTVTDADAAADADAEDTASVQSTQRPPARRGRKPKSKAFVEDSDIDIEKERAGEKRSGMRTRSQSRTRAAAAGSSGTQKPKSKVRKSRGVDENEQGKQVDKEDEEGPKKRRKVVA